MKVNWVDIDAGRVILRSEADVVWSLHRRFEVVVDDGSLPWDVTLRLAVSPDVDGVDGAAGPPVVEEVTVRRRPGGESASAAGFRRLPLGALVEEALQLAVMPWRIVADDGDKATLSLMAVGDEPLPVHPPRRIVKAFRQSGRRHERRRRNEPTPEQSESALTLYERAKASKQKDALTWVGDQLGVSRSTAHNWIQRARKGLKS